MSTNRNIERDIEHPTNILLARKIHFKRPTVHPIPLSLNDSYSKERIESIDHDEQSFSEDPTYYSNISED